MPRLACRKCGRTLWATAPVAQLFAEERRCPRCGASLDDDRRQADRRVYVRRQVKVGVVRKVGERRGEDRRGRQRRRIG